MGDASQGPSDGWMSEQRACGSSTRLVFCILLLRTILIWIGEGSGLSPLLSLGLGSVLVSVLKQLVVGTGALSFGGKRVAGLVAFLCSDFEGFVSRLCFLVRFRSVCVRDAWLLS